MYDEVNPLVEVKWDNVKQFWSDYEQLFDDFQLDFEISSLFLKLCD